MSTTCSEQTVRQFVADWVRAHAKKSLSGTVLDGSVHFVAAGIIDSMAFVRLLMDAESEFGLELDFSELDPAEFLTIDGFARSVMQCAGHGPNA
ncbi:MAG: acyl carrier protein [Pirellulaceae bacterium]|nr:acyl carrier protein [Pirellulaceae bacterium]